jgi:hypothetical protein
MTVKINVPWDVSPCSLVHGLHTEPEDGHFYRLYTSSCLRAGVSIASEESAYRIQRC